MTFMDPAAWRALAGCRLLAVDPGARYVGLAVRTCRLLGARPFGYLERQGDAGKHRRGNAPAAAMGDAAAAWTLRRADSGRHGSTEAVRRHSSLADALAAVLTEQRIAAVVYGMPYHADGSRSRESGLVERQVASLQSEWAQPWPILLWDESFSTQIAVGPRRAGGRKVLGSDAVAACVILQEVLQALRQVEEGDETALSETLPSEMRSHR